uniref:Uncharacterized protein n=1 Tax=Rhizophora mucronata TaxID=61149 RepID=A0A2P2Q860_RHIMU
MFSGKLLSKEETLLSCLQIQCWPS